MLTAPRDDDPNDDGAEFYLDGGKRELVGKFTEIESGKRSDRPELERAIAACKKHRARLIIARLGRPSRNVAFIAALVERKVDFVACDNPTANKFTIHILAVVAEFRARRDQQAHEGALAAAKAKGKILGNYARIAKPKQEATDARAEAMRPAIASTLHMSATAAADHLNRAASPRPAASAGGLRKSSTSVVGSASPPPPPNRLDYRGFGI